MNEHVHFIPVGFDFERLIQPISQGSALDADRIILLHSSGGENADRAVQLAARMVEKLDEAFDKILGLEVTIEEVTDIRQYEMIYIYAYERILDELQAGNEVYVNISSMPRTVAFAFGTAADSLAIEYPQVRNSIHTYYVSPEDYLVLDMIEELESEREFLELQIAEKDLGAEFVARVEVIDGLLEDVLERGVTEGARVIGDGRRHVDFPAPPVADLRDFEKLILRFLRDKETRSTTQLAKRLAEDEGESYDESFKSRTQYNVESLEEKGYIDRVEEGNRLRTRLSTMGRLWVETHEDALVMD